MCAQGQTCKEGSCLWPSVAFETDVYPILDAAGCGTTSCHGGTRPAEGLDLSTASRAKSALVDVASTQCTNKLLVKPKDPNQSYLINKLTGSSMCSGSRMPKGGSALTQAQLDTIRAWIAGL
ncbi:MAG TPA: hypothetical protein VJR89_42830 [Polyangiales bacterium]|nr:hypothetical protein [Polyangiales bacterium]